MLMASGDSSGALTYALPAQSATSTSAMGTASWVMTASRSRRAQQARLTNSAPNRRQYSTGPASRPANTFTCADPSDSVLHVIACLRLAHQLCSMGTSVSTLTVPAK